MVRKRKTLRKVKMLNSLTLSNKTQPVRKPLKILTTKLEATPLGNNNRLSVTPAPTLREDFQTLSNTRTWEDFNRFSVEKITL
jgi:hypothetical protein